MKKIKSTLIVVLFTVTSIAQIQMKNNDSTLNDIKLENYSNVEFRLFPTENIWTFIKLNTRNGLMWQVQFAVGDDNRFATSLNHLTLVDKKNELNDRFTLYSTENIYTFILLDQVNGRMWQVQWSLKPENRGIIPIE